MADFRHVLEDQAAPLIRGFTIGCGKLADECQGHNPEFTTKIPLQKCKLGAFIIRGTKNFLTCLHHCRRPDESLFMKEQAPPRFEETQFFL